VPRSRPGADTPFSPRSNGTRRLGNGEVLRQSGAAYDLDDAALADIAGQTVISILAVQVARSGNRKRLAHRRAPYQALPRRSPG